MSKNQLLFSVFVFLVGTYCCALSQLLLENYLKSDQPAPLISHQPAPLISDLGFFLFSCLHSSPLPSSVVDYMVALEVVFAVLGIIFFGEKKLKIVQKMLLCMGCMYFLRAISIVLTVFPNPDGSCKSDKPKYPLPFEVFRVMLRLRVTCKDVFFSGHTGFIMFCDFVTWHCLSRVKRTLAVINRLYVGSICLAIIASKFHYTIDVVTGAVVSVFIWNLFRDNKKHEEDMEYEAFLG